ncbi:MAG: TlpA family protein disulfide reductase [Pseudomonadota bacterium]
MIFRGDRSRPAAYKRYSWLAALIGALLLAGCDDILEDKKESLRVGQKAPLVRTKTLADVGGDFSRITSYRYPDERMYQLSLDKALQSGKPIVLEFATPGHCTVCDVQLQMLKSMLTKYESQVIFLHMDQYQNPEAFIAFRVKGDPWTFVIDETGTVKFKQPGRMLLGEMEAAIQRVLPRKG